jgi:hypothetical protein
LGPLTRSVKKRRGALWAAAKGVQMNTAASVKVARTNNLRIEKLLFPISKIASFFMKFLWNKAGALK